MIKSTPRYINKAKKKVHPLIPSRSDKTPYVYFLIRRHKIVYVGQTHSIRLRVHHHNCYFKYNSIRWIECEDKNLSYYEKRWIKKFQPEYNVMYTKRWNGTERPTKEI